MKRFVAMALLALPGAAGALEISTGGTTEVPWVPAPIVFEPVTFTPVRFEFVDPFSHAATLLTPPEPRPPFIGDLMLLGEPVTLTVEDDGLRLPDEQFSLD
jgi:hypothetical protein